jgi:PEGA domain-containing protein
MKGLRKWGVSLALLGSLAGCSNDTPTGGGNLPPRIVSLNASPSSVVLSGDSRVTALVSDPDNDPLRISWRATGGVFGDTTRTSTSWRAPGAPGLYLLYLSVSDGSQTVTDSVDVAVGNAALTVLSSPPFAYITLDGSATGLTAPHTFNPLPVGFHSVSLFSPYYKYQSKPGIELFHGKSDTLRFVLPPVIEDFLDLGLNNALEFGGITFLPSGLGVLYVARTATETAIFSEPLFPAATTPRGVRVVGRVRFEEPISIGPQGDLFFINSGDSLVVVPIRDRNQDGAVDSVGTVMGLLRSKYGPAVSTTYQVAYSYTPSEDPSTVPLFYAQYSNQVLGIPLSGTATFGKLPSWKPGEPFLAYQYGNAIMYSIVNPFSAPGGDTLYAPGFNTAPSWGKWGAKTVAFLHGTTSGTYTDLMITAQNAPEAVTLSRNLVDPRFIAWSPLEEIMAVTEHPGGTPRILIVSSLPLP